jgi:preprotein translocase subunit SecY
VNMFSGGAIERMSILALGIMPYISASIISNLVVATTPSLQQLTRKVKQVDAKLPSTHGTAHYFWRRFRVLR